MTCNNNKEGDVQPDKNKNYYLSIAFPKTQFLYAPLEKRNGVEIPPSSFFSHPSINHFNLEGPKREPLIFFQDHIELVLL